MWRVGVCVVRVGVCVCVCFLLYVIDEYLLTSKLHFFFFLFSYQGTFRCQNEGVSRRICQIIRAARIYSIKCSVDGIDGNSSGRCKENCC